MATTEDGIEKLHKLAELSTSLTEFHKLRKQLSTCIANSHDEETKLVDYKEELETLSNEKLQHVEELRHINADMNTLEMIIKQAENVQNKSKENACCCMMRLNQMKMKINEYRAAVGDDPIEFPDDAFLSPPNMLGANNRLLEFCNTLMSSQPPTSMNLTNFPNAVHGISYCNASEPSETSAKRRREATENNDSVNEFIAHQQHQQQQPLNYAFPAAAAAALSFGGAGGLGVMPGGGMSNSFDPVSSIGKQQPAPMKTCASCQQLIHRNAPICPLCKSKSRSRNPKRGKKNAED